MISLLSRLLEGTWRVPFADHPMKPWRNQRGGSRCRCPTGAPSPGSAQYTRREALARERTARHEKLIERPRLFAARTSKLCPKRRLARGRVWTRPLFDPHATVIWCFDMTAELDR